MEAYRALGFHAMDRALSEDKIVADHLIPDHAMIWDMKRKIGKAVKSSIWIMCPRGLLWVSANPSRDASESC
jgi:hypothetical protein